MSGGVASIGMTWPTLDHQMLESEFAPPTQTEDTNLGGGPTSGAEAGAQGDAKFFVVISRRSGFRRLRKYGCCGIIPWDCQRVEWIQDVTSKSADAQCKACLRTFGRMIKEDESSSSGSSSSTDEQPEAQLGDSDLG